MRATATDGRDQRDILTRQQLALISRRVLPFAIGWLGAMVIWVAVFASEGVLTPAAALVVGAEALLLMGVVWRCRSDPTAPGVLPLVLATCIALGVLSTILVAIVRGRGEILAFMLLSLYLAAAWLFAWGWRAELVLLVTTLAAWGFVLDRFAFVVRPLDFFAAVTIGAALALAIAEGAERSFRYLALRRWAQARMTHELETSRNAYRDLAEHARDLIWTCDRELRFTYVNEAAIRFLGRPATAILGRPIPEFYTDNVRNADVDGLLARAAAGGDLPPFLTEIVTPSGPRWIEVVGSLVRDESGTPSGLRGISRDVSERVAAETALRESEERFRSAFDYAAIGMVVVGMDGKPIRVNRAFGEMLGYESAELEARTMDTVVHSDDVARARTEIERLLRGEIRVFQMEMRHFHKDGHIVWCLFSCSLTRTVLGRPQHLIAQVQDISERKAAEDALRTSEARYRGLIESAHDPVTRYDPAGHLTFANEACCRAIGYRYEDILGRNPIFLVHAEDRAETIAAFRKVLRPPYRYRFESRGLTPQGWRWVEWEVSGVRDVGGRVVEIQQVGRDVTARRQAEAALRESEERFRSAFEDAAIGMGVTTIDGHLLRVNRAFCDMLGYAEHELLGRSLREIIHPEDHEILGRDQARLFDGSAETYRSERRYLRADGEVVWVVATASVIHDPERTPLYVIGQIQDVTERRLAEEALRDSLADLTRSEEKLRLLAQRQVTIREEERKRVSFDIHDDVCQELVGVGILMASLRRKLAPMPVEHAAEFERVIGYLGEVVEHLRLLARELRPLLLRELGLGGGLRSLADGMSSVATRVVAEIQAVIPRLDEEVEVAIYRIAHEALTNAMRYAAAHRIVVALTVADGRLHLEVRDDGRGFDPAARSAPALGIVSMEERALALGGRLDISTRPGQGTTVALDCPLEGVMPRQPLESAAPGGTADSSPPSPAITLRSAARD